MARLLYFAFPTGGVQGGQKMILRHVEALRGLGFDATCVTGPQNVVPEWFEHRAPIITAYELRQDDILVLPDDAHDALRKAAALPHRRVVFAQNPYIMAALSLSAMDGFAADRFPPFIAVGRGLAGLINRLYPQAQVELVPCFADERTFRPRGPKRAAIAYVPKKRPLEAKVIPGLFERLHPRHRDLDWTQIEKASERRVADVFAESSLLLSLSRLESVGMTPLEAMACGCVCAGFTGVGGGEYATTDNGFWVPDDDCVAAADALAEAADVVKAGGPALQRRIEAGRETAARWSYAVFRAALEEVWMRLAPEARLQDGPLD
ncbi:MAG: hypothetical protein JWP73_458 [Phenylobacterium sp.]|nr:hypothetical protein [Phenylobacterium sp.]